MKSLSITFAAGLLLASCSGTTGKSPSATATPAPDIQHTWQIENVVVNDTLYARPAEINPDLAQLFTFAPDSTFGITTNCNSLGGQYVQSGDSISFSNILATQMACDNEEVERLLMRILPEVCTVDSLNDSVMRLNTPSSAYIVLKKAGD